MSDWCRRVRANRIAALALMYTVAHSSVAAAAPEPVRALVWRCLPEIGSTSGTESAFGEIPAKRGTTIWFAYTTRSAADDNDKPGVATATTRVEICWARQGVFTCPGLDFPDAFVALAERSRSRCAPDERVVVRRGRDGVGRSRDGLGIFPMRPSALACAGLRPIVAQWAGSPLTVAPIGAGW